MPEHGVTFRICRVILAAASWLVPAGQRRDWRAEWEAEAAWRSGQAGPGAALPLFTRCAGAFIHAAWLRKEEWRMETFFHDVRFAIRLARRERGFAAIAVLTLALGIGANAALFTVLNGTLLAPLPFRDPDRLVLAWETLPSAGVTENTPAPATYADWRARARTVTSLAALSTGIVNVAGDGEPARLFVLRTSADLPATLGISPALGRPFRPDEDRPGGPRAVLLSDDLWTRRYARDPAVVGRTMRLDGIETTIVGVLPPDLPMPLTRVDAWLPLALSPREAASESRMLWVFGRLAPGATIHTAQRELASLLQERMHAGVADIGAHVQTIDEVVRGEVRPDLRLVFSGTALVLLIACANVATMLLARGTARGREFAVRSALGASGSRLLRQSASESLVLAIAGGTAGWLLAAWLVRLLATSVPAALRERIIARTDGHVLLFVAGISVGTTIVFGLVPALVGMRARALHAAGGARATEPRGLRSLRGLLVAIEVALAVVLVSAAGLLGRTFAHLLRTDMGFSPDHVLTLQIDRGDGGGRDARVAFYTSLLERLDAVPGVRAVGLSNGLPVRLTGGGSGFFPEGAPREAFVRGNHRIVSGGYFAALGIPLLEGRTFTDADRAGRPLVAVVSRAFADRAWPGRDPIGQRFSWGPPTGAAWITVVGVAGDVRLARTLPPSPHAYFPFTQVPDYVTGDVAIRVDGDPLAAVPAVRAVVRELDAEQPIANLVTFDRLLSDSLGRRRFTLTLMGLFGALALVLSAIGLYGVVAFVVGRRTREIGVRLALGASGWAVRLRVLRDGLVMAAAGALCGVGLSVLAARVGASLVPGLGSVDPLTLASAVALLLAVAALACDIPARRAARTDPTAALRNE